ncbi:hypothetical protein [Thalassospira alkalitolerans]|uniref:hypothetical protein n=1 Tax=Thalassospira alkalitolerans TaxID=1293890 RepID=UPI003AA8EB85
MDDLNDGDATDVQDPFDSMDDIYDQIMDSENEPAEEQSLGPSRDESGRFAKTESTEDAAHVEEDEPAEEEAADQADDTDQPEEKGTDEPATVIDPPISWSAEAKAKFAEAPPEIQREVLKREADFERGIAQKGQELSTLRQQTSEMEQALSPVLSTWQQNGVAPAVGVQRLVAADAYLQRDPVGGLQQIARAYGVDLQSLSDGDGNDPAPVNPQIQAQLQAHDQFIRNFQLQQQQTETNRIASDIDAFASAMGADGQPAHPHFDAVFDDIKMMLPALKQANPTATISDLVKQSYEKAVWANPTTRDAILKAERAQQAKKQTEERSKAAKDAKRAAKGNVRGRGEPVSPGGKTWEETIDEIGSRLSG